ncbi:hypothetical protein NC651_032999 [Populus alba x Populus x berolinensis]|nr:hypothetical protein NC651_032999 [Populus alba x Populus x berolinensis]
MGGKRAGSESSAQAVGEEGSTCHNSAGLGTLSWLGQGLSHPTHSSIEAHNSSMGTIMLDRHHRLRPMH